MRLQFIKRLTADRRSYPVNWTTCEFYPATLAVSKFYPGLWTLDLNALWMLSFSGRFEEESRRRPSLVRASIYNTSERRRKRELELRLVKTSGQIRPFLLLRSFVPAG